METNQSNPPDKMPLFIQQSFSKFTIHKFSTDADTKSRHFDTFFDLLAGVPKQIAWMKKEVSRSLMISAVKLDGEEVILCEIEHPSFQTYRRCGDRFIFPAVLL